MIVYFLIRVEALRRAKSQRVKDGIRRRVQEALEDDCEADTGSVNSGDGD